jgi:hypothetical protein
MQPTTVSRLTVLLALSESANCYGQMARSGGPRRAPVTVSAWVVPLVLDALPARMSL